MSEYPQGPESERPVPAKKKENPYEPRLKGLREEQQDAQEVPKPPVVKLESKNEGKDRAAETEAMEKILPIENFDRFELRSILLAFVERNVIRQEDIPSWVYAEADGESLYTEGWRLRVLKKNIADWRAFIEENKRFIP